MEIGFVLFRVSVDYQSIYLYSIIQSRADYSYFYDDRSFDRVIDRVPVLLIILMGVCQCL